MSLAGETRKKSILALLNEQGKVVAGELAQQFEVSTETIRRDLDELDRAGMLRKVYGGAVPVRTETEPSLYEREAVHVEEKRRIGLLAARLIADNDVIVLDEGTTILQIIPHLGHIRNLTVLTNSIPALMMLIESRKREQFDGKIVMIGGEVSMPHMRVFGPVAERTMEDFYVHKSFVSVDAVSLEYGITSYDYEKAAFTRKIMQNSDTVIVVADASKINKRTVAKIAGLQNVHAIVSDAPAPDEWQQALPDLDVRWISPDPADQG